MKIYKEKSWEINTKLSWKIQYKIQNRNLYKINLEKTSKPNPFIPLHFVPLHKSQSSLDPRKLG